MQLTSAFLARLLPGLVVFASTPVLFRAYGAIAYGDYARVWSGTLVASSIMTAWLAQAILREAGLSRARRSVIPGKLVILQLLGGGVGSLVIAWLGVQNRSPLIFFASFCFGAFSCGHAVAASIVQRDERIHILAIAELTKATLAVSVPLLLLKFTHSAWAMVIGAAIAALAAWVVCWRPGEITFSAPIRRSSRQWRYGWPMAVWRGLSNVLLYIDRFVVAWLFTPAIAGAYSAVSDLIVRGFGMVAFPIVMVAHPRIMRVSNQGASRADVNKEIRRWISGSAILLAAAIVVFLLIHVPLLDWFIGPSMRLAFLPVVFLTVLACMWQLALLAHKSLEVEFRTKTMLLLMVISCAVSVILCVTLSYLIGVQGAPLGAALGALLYLTMVFHVSRKGTRS